MVNTAYPPTTVRGLRLAPLLVFFSILRPHLEGLLEHTITQRKSLCPKRSVTP
jgi:hypothetical protein